MKVSRGRHCETSTFINYISKRIEAYYEVPALKNYELYDLENVDRKMSPKAKVITAIQITAL